MQHKDVAQSHPIDLRRLGHLCYLDQTRRYAQPMPCGRAQSHQSTITETRCLLKDAGQRNRWRVRIRQGMSPGGDNEVFREERGKGFTNGFREPYEDSLPQPGMPARTGEQLSAQLFGDSLLPMQVTEHAAARKSDDDSEMTAEQKHPFDGWAEGNQAAQAAAGREKRDAAAGWEEERSKEQAEDQAEQAEEDTHMVKMYKEIEQRGKEAEARQAAAESGAGLQAVPANHPVALRLAELAAQIETDSTGWSGEAADSGAADSELKTGAGCIF